MKEKRVCLAFLVFFLLVFGRGSLWAAENLVLNPGFERASEGLPDNWTIAVAQNGGAARVDTAICYAGKQSLRLEQTRPISLPAGALASGNIIKAIREAKAEGYVLVTQNVPVEEGKSYNFRFRYRTEGLLPENRSDPLAGYGHFQAWIFWLNDQYQSVGSEKERHVWVVNTGANATDWVEVVNEGFASSRNPTKRPYLAPPGAVWANIRFSLNAAAPEITPKVWVDEVVFEEY